MPKSFFLIILLSISIKGFSNNPIVEGIGMSDPHVRVFNDTIYLFTGHDNHPDDKTWVMKNWRVFMTTDLINWKQINTISPEHNYMDNNSTDCWAGDAAYRNGKYYFYFSDRKRGIGVMQANTPNDLFIDVLGKPLVSPMHDPTILIDDDALKTPYMVYGDKEGDFHAVRLNPDMVSIAEKPKPIKITGKEWELAPFWMDKNYIFKHKNNYYLSWGRDYAISDNIYGPYESAGSVGNGHNLDEYAHGSFFWWKGQFYHMWCYYIRPGYKFRETIISYCHFDDGGYIVTDTRFLDKHFKNGVGKYNVSWDKIEAEWYTEKSDSIIKTGNAEEGFRLTNLENNSWVKLANVNFDIDVNSLNFRLKGAAGTAIEVRVDSLSGRLLGELTIPGLTKNFNDYGVSLDRIQDIHDVFFVFKNEKNSEISLDWFSFQKK